MTAWKRFKIICLLLTSMNFLNGSLFFHSNETKLRAMGNVTYLSPLSKSPGFELLISLKEMGFSIYDSISSFFYGIEVEEYNFSNFSLGILFQNRVWSSLSLTLKPVLISTGHFTDSKEGFVNLDVLKNFRNFEIGAYLLGIKFFDQLYAKDLWFGIQGGYWVRTGFKWKAQWDGISFLNCIEKQGNWSKMRYFSPLNVRVGFAVEKFPRVRVGGVFRFYNAIVNLKTQEKKLFIDKVITSGLGFSFRKYSFDVSFAFGTNWKFWDYGLSHLTFGIRRKL